MLGSLSSSQTFFLGLIGQLKGLTQQGEGSNMGAASPWPSSRTGNDNRLPGSTEGKKASCFFCL